MKKKKKWLCQTKVVWTKARKRKYRFALLVLIAFNIGVIFAWCWNRMEEKIPNHLYLFKDDREEMDLDVPVIDYSTNPKKKLQKSSDKIESSYEAELKLFGFIPYKKIDVDVIEEEKVMPLGKAVGLYIQSDGIMVLGTSEIEGQDGKRHIPAKGILKSGDRIYEINGKKMSNIYEIQECVSACKKNKVTITLIRNKERISVNVPCVVGKDGKKQLGVWLREDTEGIGTLSFVDEKNRFAALGHGIADIDTGKLIHLQSGSVYTATIDAVKKGISGEPGELIGSVLLSKENCVGKIQSNTIGGITGTLSSAEYQYDETKALPIGLKQEVKKGKAYIQSQIGNEVKKYEIEIEHINVNGTTNKAMSLKVTDKELLKKTGGIVQGMSGSPIIQDGRVIGAVTHVLVNDPTRGYGIFIENMLEH